MPTPPKFDWNLICTEYCQGFFELDNETGVRRHIFPSMQQLADRHGCSVNTIRDRSCKENWALKKELIQTKIKAKLEENQIPTLFVVSSKFDAQNLNKIQQVHKLLDVYFGRFNMLSDPDNNTLILDDDCPEINVKELQSIVAVLKESHALVRAILGEQLHPNNLDQAVDILNTTTNKADTKNRRNRIKNLHTKLSAKEEAEQQLLSRKNELEKLLKAKKNPPHSSETE